MRLRPRRGVALALMLFALVAIAAIAQAIVAPAMASHRAARRLMSRHAAESAVERTLASLVGGWTLADWDSSVVDTTASIHVVAGGGTAADLTIITQVRPLSARVFSFSGTVTTPLPDAAVAVRRSVLVERHVDTLTRVPALTAGGDIELAADATVDADGACPGDVKAEAAILTGPASRATGGDLAGGPVILRDEAAIDPSTYAHPAGLEAARLAASADVILIGGTVVSPSPTSSSDACVPGPANWGFADLVATGDPCGGHAPIVRAAGDLTIAGGEGQGVLLVDGRLSITGPFRYRGLIVATGGVETSGEVDVTGGVFTGPAAGARIGAGGARLQASSCALSAAADRTARLRLVPHRWWWR